LLVNLSGRGDKDVDIAARWFGHLGESAAGGPEAGGPEASLAAPGASR
jgi:tryptophan synthase beta chain